uniref:Uncharacterized protein n=1 Tax=Anguilla anguilla TaxID=7936 RepID=A0A0E9UKH5_ANGAN
MICGWTPVSHSHYTPQQLKVCKPHHTFSLTQHFVSTPMTCCSWTHGLNKINTIKTSQQ